MTGVGSRHRPRRDWKPVAASVDRPRVSQVLQSFLPFPDGCQGTSPYQQGRGTKMVTKTEEHCYGGIDVSMDRLDVMVLPERRGFSVDNNAAGWTELIERLHGSPVAAIGIEPSGGGPGGGARRPPPGQPAGGPRKTPKTPSVRRPPRGARQKQPPPHPL